ncbi:gastrokine-1-like [Poecile atricapillus]|uniref:gastrokine-1-like n=1 Tax=Poecile atricapillus TaxID=48891 RepID=UPI002739BA05|nr:gastrokine-1-like [Poecile atricapillus]
MPARTCYISTMNRSEMPTFAALVRVAAERRNLMNLGRPSRRITFVTNGLVNNLSSYGAHVFSMCRGLPTYRAQEVQGPLYSQQSCTALDILRLVELRYCSGNGHILN